MNTDQPAPAQKLRLSFQKRLALLLLMGGGTLFLCEYGLRFLLFSKNEAVADFAETLRKPTNFASLNHGDVGWKLIKLFAKPGTLKEPGRPDPTLGWLNPQTDAETFAHMAEARVGQRRPVLLLGDSYADCVADVPCWPRLLDESPSGSEFAIVNYGVGGYGFDQIVLSMTRALDRFEGKNPIVMISLMVDGDLDRSALRFRSWPKPYFTLTEEGGLKLASGELPPTSMEYLEQHPPQVFSYLLRWFVFGSGIWSDDGANKIIPGGLKFEEKRELNRRLIELAIETCESRGVEYFFVLFNSRRGAVWPTGRAWPNGFMRKTLQQLEAPYVTANRDLFDEMAATGAALDEFFILSGKGRNHYNERGNRAVLPAIIRGLNKDYDVPGQERDLPPWKQVQPKGKGLARVEHGLHGPFTAPEDEHRLMLTTVPKHPTVLVFKLYGRADRFSAIMKSLPSEGGGEAGDLKLVLRANKKVIFNKTLRPGDDPLMIDVDLAGADQLSLSIPPRAPSSSGADLYLASPRLQWVTTQDAAVESSGETIEGKD